MKGTSNDGQWSMDWFPTWTRGFMMDTWGINLYHSHTYIYIYSLYLYIYTHNYIDYIYIDR